MSKRTSERTPYAALLRLKRKLRRQSNLHYRLYFSLRQKLESGAERAFGEYDALRMAEDFVDAEIEKLA